VEISIKAEEYSTVLTITSMKYNGTDGREIRDSMYCKQNHMAQTDGPLWF